jgi:hypothetical protein
MGNCASGADVDNGKPRANEDPELMGKAKFLSCPAMSEVVAPDQGKWLLIVFAPLTHHGLIFAARHSDTGALMVKDIVDKQVTKEKEDQKVQLSYNLFFKAISTEVAKAGRSGAKVDWLPDGTISVECKIAISGSASSNKKPDTYTAVLKPIDSSEENLFKYIAEPLATHYCKKRTDGWNLDRPDPNKEKQYGEQEANAIIRAASTRESKSVLDRELPKIGTLRRDHATARADRDAAVAKVNLMKQMLLTRSVEPPLLRLPPDDAFAACDLLLSGLNFVAAAQDPHLAFPNPKDLNSALNAPAMPVETEGLDVSALDGFAPPAQLPVYHTGLAVSNALQVSVPADRLQRFFHRLDHLHRSSNAFHNGRRAAERLQSFGFLVTRATAAGFKPTTEMLTNALVAAAIHDADHCGLNNQHGYRSSLAGYIPTLYSYESQVERHSLAVGLVEAAIAEIVVDRDAVASMVLATDMSQHQDFLARFTRRSRHVADFSRRLDDQVLAFAALLKCADLCHFYKSKEHCDASMRDLATELHRGNEASGLSDVSHADTKVFATHIALPMFTAVASAFSTLQELPAACARVHVQ